MTGNAVHAMKNTLMNGKADEKGFIVVYPDGTGWSKNAMLTWNSGQCCAYAMDKKVDDAGFIRALIESRVAWRTLSGVGLKKRLGEKNRFIFDGSDSRRFSHPQHAWERQTSGNLFSLF